MTRSFSAPTSARLAIVVAVLLLMATSSLAQTVTAERDIFARGRVRGGFTGGWVSTSGDDYLQLGLGLGYNLADGLTAGLDYETWLVGDPTVHKLAPWLGYTYWKARSVKPYAAVFLRQNWVDGFDNYKDLGVRAGLMTRRGRTYVGVGLAYEYRLDDRGFADRDRIYPEVRVAIGL
jgi:hypothetical protein